MPRGRPKKVVVEDAFKEVVETVEKIEEAPIEKPVEVKKPGRGRPKKNPTPEVTPEINTVKEEPTEKRVFNNRKILIVVDMQNDFINGTLANKSAEKIINPMCEFIKNYDGEILFTQDTHHDDDYLDSFEGKKLPIKHCIVNTDGWQIHSKLIETTKETGRSIRTSWKWFFGGGENIKKVIENSYPDAPFVIDMVGTCTDICVISNALQLRTLYPDTEINVYADLCAGLTPQKHKAALEVMRSCQINVIENSDEKTV